MPELSPQAQAVVDAYWATPNEPITTKGRLPRVAAALEALADQAETVLIVTGPGFSEFDVVMRVSDIRSIANELNGDSNV
jgi:hypothetical protein